MRGWDKNFEDFKTQIYANLVENLPGVDAQFRLMPPGRIKPNFANIERQNPRRAGVLALFYPDQDIPHLVLMKRNIYQGVHSGQISLPGGQKEALDKDLTETALRETHEEIGVEKAHIEVAGLLTRVFIPPSNFLVQPVVGFATEKPVFTPDAREVNQILEIPFRDFIHKTSLKVTQVAARGMSYEVPAYHVHNEIIWGATAMMIAEIVALVETD